MLKSYNEFLNFIKSLNTKPTLLLHACCAPCSSHCLMVLKDFFDITIFFSNDNIDDLNEFNKRFDELTKFIKNANLDVKLVKDSYDYNLFLEAIKGKEDLGERSIRCYECYKLRLNKTALYAKENSFDYFSTTLSISPYKNSKWLNEIGYILENTYNTKYLYSDSKKENGYKDSINLSLEYGLYRQDYCGCKFSKKEREEHVNDRLTKEV